MLFQVTQAGWQERQYCDTRAVQWHWGNGTPHKKKLWRAGICLKHFRLLPQKRDYIFRLLSHSLTRPVCVLLHVCMWGMSVITCCTCSCAGMTKTCVTKLYGAVNEQSWAVAGHLMGFCTGLKTEHIYCMQNLSNQGNYTESRTACFGCKTF